MKYPIRSVALLCGMLSAPALGQATQPVEGARPAVVYLLPEGQTNGRYRPAAPTFPQPAPIVVPPEEIAQQYSCVLRVDAEDESNGYTGLVGNDPQTAVALLTSTALLDPAVEKTVKLSPRQRRADVVVNVYPVGQRLVRLEVILRNPEVAVKYPADAAEKLAAALVEQLRAAYDQSAQTSHKAAAARRTPLEKDLASAKARLDELRGKEREVRSQMASMNQFGDANTTLINLRNQKRSIESELSRNRARLSALEPAAPAGSGWAEVVQLRQQQLDEMKKNKASAAKIAEQETRIAEAKDELAQSRRASSSSPNDQYRSNEIVNLKTTIADAEERLKPVNQQIAKLEDPKFVALVDQLPEMQQEENRLRSQIVDLTNRLDQLHRTQQAEGAVTVTVLDGKQR